MAEAARNIIASGTTASSTGREEMKGMKVVALHGWRTNAKILKFQTQSLARYLQAEFRCMDAPQDASGPPQEDIKKFFPGQRYFEWWDAVDDGEGGKRYENYSDSVEAFTKVLREQGPFEAAFGFSQGAAFLTAYISQLEREGAEVPFRLLILCGGIPPADNTLRVTQKLKTRSVHIIGEEDPLKPKSEELAKLYENAAVVSSPASHMPPSARHAECFPFIQQAITAAL